ncbi:hypothetical protein B0T19DRAFT_414832 [Cercophora scortea]|uniref:Uncharacterized protein n=1 Tax=Cercophora scortea TaxID=314031 RepID=A0AAE0MIC0_9PEZI|nr:hypothetical protein B0T19DRAFT_414832 [Cercophora scortea]
MSADCSSMFYLLCTIRVADACMRDAKGELGLANSGPRSPCRSRPCCGPFGGESLYASKVKGTSFMYEGSISGRRLETLIAHSHSTGTRTRVSR